MNRVLIVDDEKNYLIVLEDLLTDEGYEVFTASSPADALELIRKTPVDVVVSDIKMPGMSGVELLDRLLEYDPDLPIILMTAFAEVDQAVAAMKKGAVDHLQKPFDNNDLKQAVARGLERRKLSRNVRRISSGTGGTGTIIGQSAEMERVFSIIRRVSGKPTTVLITGESGTGKELVARAIHNSSPRVENAFVSINCAAMPENLLESELFGHEKGSFTGAYQTKSGKFEIASGGTIFLDEVGDMPLALQAKVLRVLQEQEFQRVGGNRDIKVDVRVVAATNQDLKHLVENGGFRGDLFFRLKVVHVQLPPLRDRRSDIPLLIAYFVKKISNKVGTEIKEIDPKVVSVFQDYHWPGNVRELENVLEHAIVLSRGGKIKLGDLPPDLNCVERDHKTFEDFIPIDANLTDALDAMEERMIREALGKSGNVQAQAAKSLGISRSNLQYKMKKYGLIA